MAEDERGRDQETETMALLMAHDLRNMFSVLSGLIILLERRNDPRYIELMKKQLDFCEQIVTSFVRFAQEGGPARRTIEVAPMIEGLMESIPLPESIHWHAPDGLPGIFIGDPGQVRQILWNVLANAVDACGSKPSEILVRSREEAGFVCIEVEDTAGGIPLEIRERLMEKGITTKAAGLGLGLYLSRRLAEGNGGRLECESMKGIGTTFRLWLPAAL